MTPTRLPVDSAAAAEQALLRHPGVSAATVFTHGDGLLALVVPTEAYFDESLDRSAAAATALRKWQKTYDLNQSSKAAVAAPPGFNTIGWDSSYTRGPLPLDDMREWVRTSVDSILRLGAHSIYEIGCGTGMLLLRIAPLCERYVAVDFSHEVLARVREQLQSMPAVAARVELMERRADNFAGLEPHSFDTVVINSAIQYFPHAAYLARVLENAIGLVRDGGHVFIGDVRSLPLLPAFAASVELFQAADDLPVEELRERIRRRLRHAPELVLSPAWFLALGRRLNRVAHVAIALRHGRADNEMTRYRYDAILRVGPARPPVSFAIEPASADPIAQIRGRLQERGEAFGIGGIANARVEKDCLALAAITAADAASTAADLRRQLEQVSLRGTHPQDLFDLEAAYPGLQVSLSWAAARSDGSYDAVVIPDDGEPDAAVAVPEPPSSAFLHTVTAPGQAGIRAQLVERLLDHCREHLPQSAVPERLVLVDAIPAGLDAAAAWAELPSLEGELPVA